MTPEQFLVFADPLPEPMLLLTGSGDILAGNHAVEMRLGLELSGIQGRNLANAVSDTPDEVANYLRSCSRSRSLVLGSLAFLAKGGGSVQCRMEGTLLRPRTEGADAILLLRLIRKESAVGQFVALNQKVEELGKEIQRRRRAEEQVQEEREWLRVTLASIGDGVIATDTQGRVTYLNAVAEELTGWTSNDAEAKPIEAVFPILNEQTRQPVKNPVEKVLLEGVIVGLGNHTILIAKDGTERPINDSAAPIRDATGKMIGVVMVFRDVTEHRRAERELRESEARKSVILETALDCIISMDHHGKVVDFNPAAQRTFGYSRGDVVGRELADLIIPSSLRAQHRQGLAHYLATGEGPVLGKRLELSALRADGSEFPVEVAITRISTDGPPLFTAYLRDISERIRAEQYRNARLGVTQALNQASDVREGASRVLRAVCESLAWDVGFFWLVNKGGDSLECHQSWHKAELPVTEFEAGSFNRTFKKGEGLPGYVWSTGKSHWLLDVVRDANFARAASAAKYNLHSAFACPVVVGDRVIGVIEFFTRHIREPDADLLEMMGTVAGNFGQFIQRRSAEQELRQSEAELADFFDNATVSLHWVGADGIILRANRAELNMLGYSREEFVGRPIADYHADEDVICDILHRLQTGENLSEYPARLRCKDGSIKDVLIDSSVLFREGRFVHTRCFTRDISEQKRAEEELRYRHELLRTITDTATTAIFMMDEQSRCTFMNPAAEQMTGYSLREADGKILHDLIHHTRPDGSPYPVSECPIDRALPENSIVHNHDDLFVRKDRSMFPVLCNARPVTREGVIVGTVIEVRDITLQKLAEAALRESEERLRLALDAGRMGVWDWHIRTGELKWSHSLEPLHGLAPGTFGGTFDHFQQLIHPEDRETVIIAIQQALETGGEFYVEFRNARPNGGVHWIAGSGKVFLGDDRQPLRMIGIGLDVTQRKRAEQTSRFLADASATLAVLVDLDSTLHRVSSLAVPSFADWATVDLVEEDGTLRRVSVSHIDPTKVQLAQEVHRRFPPDPAAPKGVWNILRTGKSEIVSEITDELLVQSANDAELLGILRELGLKSYIGVPLTVRGKTLGVITFINAESGHRYDNTDLAVAEDLASRAAIAIENAQLYQELREADRRKDEFLATLAHELRNPLAPVRNALEILKMPRVDPETVKRSREMMERQVQHLVRLVDDLLDVSRVMRGKIELRREKVELATIVARAVDTVQPLVDAQGHRLNVSIPADSLLLDADPVRLAQVVGNLLTNAAKYTDPNGQIWLTGEREDDMAVLRVRDSGIGIGEEMLPRIFDLFVQVDHASTKAQGGLGIGLTLVKNLVEMHNGIVQAHSNGLGQGSEFIVKLPLVAQPLDPDQAPVTERGSCQSPAPSGKQLLIVDDNQDAANSLAMVLKLQHHEVRVAYSGMAALETLKTYTPDVVFLDIGMPGMDGYEVARRIRQTPGLGNVVLAALTGWGQQEDRRRTAIAGFDHHLVKPLEPNVLESVLTDSTHR